MLLTITYNGKQTEDLGYLLYKNPARPQAFDLSMGKAYVFYPEVSDERTTVALMVKLNPLDLAKGRDGAGEKGLFAYVNDRPYVASSFMSNAIAKVFGTAMTGRCDSRPDLANSRLDLAVEITMLPVRGEKGFVNDVFEPLGYEVFWESFPVDEEYPSWGECDYVNLKLRGMKRLSEVLNQIYVLIPVFDRQRHYYMGETEIDNLIKHGAGWLPDHPLMEKIVRRYFFMAKSYAKKAIELMSGNNAVITSTEDEESEELKWSLDRERLSKVRDEIVQSGARSCLDIGCGEGKLLQMLLEQKEMDRISGVDVSPGELKKAADRLDLAKLPERKREKISLFQGSLMYQDERFFGYDCLSIVEVLEHIEPERLPMMERVVFRWTRPKTVIVTTPNRSYNEHYGLKARELRNEDHRFEWDEKEFRQWIDHVCNEYGYHAVIKEIGTKEGETTCPTQMGVFTL